MASLQEIVTEGYEVTISGTDKSSAGKYSDFTIVESKSTKNKAEGNKLINGPVIVWVASGCSKSGYSFVTGGGSFNPNTEKCKSDTVPTILRTAHYKTGCEGSCSGLFIMSGTPPTPYTCSCDFEITDANQTKCKCK